MLKFICDRVDDFNAGYFVNELAEASKFLGFLEAKVDSYKFTSILIPILNTKEAISSMYIEGTQTTITDVLENAVNPKVENEKIAIEISNHTSALVYGAEYLRTENFSHSFIQNIHKIMMDKIIDKNIEKSLGKYKTKDNKIVNSAGTTVFTPPSCTQTKKYMDELINFMNSTDELHPLIKAAIIHSQFESIHPFSDGNGRVGRILVSLYLYKTKVINFPFFYISEAISQDKRVYYNKLTNSREDSYDEWIKYFLTKIIIQTRTQIRYIDSLENLYSCTKKTVTKVINTPKFDEIISYIFTHPVMNADSLADAITVSHGQAIKYLNVLEKNNVILGDDKKRKRTFFFSALLDLSREY